MTKLFPQPKGEAAKQLSELERAVVKARQRERDVDLEHAKVVRRQNQLQEQVTEAFARDAPPATLKKELAEVRRELREDWPPQLSGIRRAKERAVVAKQRFIAEHFGELAAELLPEAENAADAVQDALDALTTARQRWAAVADRFQVLMRDVPGIRGLVEPMPHLRLKGADDALAQVDGNVPLPAPRIPSDLLPEGTPDALRFGGAPVEEDEEEDDVAEAV